MYSACVCVTTSPIPKLDSNLDVQEKGGNGRQGIPLFFMAGLLHVHD